MAARPTNDEFCHACRVESLDAVRALLARGADVNCADQRGDTPLHYAASSGRLDTAELLCSSGAVSRKNKFGELPMRVALRNFNEPMVRLLWKYGANIDATDNFGQSSLHHASVGGNAYLVGRLCELGANAEVRDVSQRQTAVIAAAACGRADSVDVLCRNGADVLAATRHGETALGRGARSDHTPVTLVLLRRTAAVVAAAAL